MSLALSEKTYRTNLSDGSSERLQELLIINEIDSTNSYLQRFGDPNLGKANVCIAEQQSAGKGRHGKSWKSIFGGSLLYSISWMFPQMPRDFSALTLAVGVEVQETLADLGFRNVQLKWPNDLLVENAKLGGILLEVAQRKEGIQLVCGVGMNILHGIDASEVEQKLVSLQDILPENKKTEEICRNYLAAKITDRLIALFRIYPSKGFTLWKTRWQNAHAFAGDNVQVTSPEKIVKGIALGVDQEGAFLVQTEDKIERFISNDVSVRKISR